MHIKGVFNKFKFMWSSNSCFFLFFFLVLSSFLFFSLFPSTLPLYRNINFATTVVPAVIIYPSRPSHLADATKVLDCQIAMYNLQVHLHGLYWPVWRQITPHAPSWAARQWYIAGVTSYSHWVWNPNRTQAKQMILKIKTVTRQFNK